MAERPARSARGFRPLDGIFRTIGGIYRTVGEIYRTIGEIYRTLGGGFWPTRRVVLARSAK